MEFIKDKLFNFFQTKSLLQEKEIYFTSFKSNAKKGLYLDKDERSQQINFTQKLLIESL